MPTKLTHFEPTLFESIYRGDLSGIEAILVALGSKQQSALNYQLTKEDIEKCAERLGNPSDISRAFYFSESGFGACGYEPGMTPLMMALSLERLNIAKLLLHDGRATMIDFSKTNDVPISHLHFLLMCSYGDHRYNKHGESIETNERASNYETDVDSIARVIIAFSKDFILDDQNMIAEAIGHHQLGIARRLLHESREKAPFPCNFDEIRQYILDDQASPTEAAKRLHAVKDLLTPHYLVKATSPAVMFQAPEEKLPLIKAEDIKTILRNFGQYEPFTETIELIKAFLVELHAEGKALSPDNFTGCLTGGFASNTLAPVKEFLQDDDTYKITAPSASTAGL